MRIFCTYLCDYNDRNDYYLSLMPYGITTIAAYLEKEGYEVILANLSSCGYLKGAEITDNNKPDAVAISIFSFNRTESFKYIKKLKQLNNSIMIIAGGQHPTFLHDEIISRYPEIDFIIKGEGEYAIKKLLDSSFSDKKQIIEAERVTDIDFIPYPSLFHGRMIGVNPYEQFKYIITSRGCPSSCTYCSSPYFWKKKVTYRNPEKIVEELKYIHKKFGIIYFSLRDDNFTLNKKRVLEFCRLLNNSSIFMMWNCQARVDTIDEEMLVAMKKCGLEHIQFGVESGSEKILKIYDKHITPEKIQRAAELTRKAGIYLSFYLMTGMRDETEEDLNDTKNLITFTRPHDVVISPVAYYPGTKIYTDSIKNNLIDNNIWFNTHENGLYLTQKKHYEKNIKLILSHASKISLKSAYNLNDFKIHRDTTGKKCWMNYIIEGNYYSDKSDFKKLKNVYNEMIADFPANIWGYLKLAEITCHDSPQKALKLLEKAADLVPSYYGTYYQMALIQYKSNNINEAKNFIKTASKMNPYDTDISILVKKITDFKYKHK